MKKIFYIISIFIVVQLSAQKTLTTEDWRNDLNFLQHKIHKDYTSLFVKTTKTDFDTKIKKLHQDIPNLQEHEIIVRMTEIIASFEYGHTGIYFGLNPMKFHSFPFNLYEYNDGIFIEGVSKVYEKALGSKVLKINNIDISEALEKVKSVVNSENSQYFKAYGINYLTIAEVLHAKRITSTLQKTIELTLEKDGKVFQMEFNVLPKGQSVSKKYSYIQQNENWLTARNQNSTPLYLKHLDKVYFQEYLPKHKAIYVRHSKISDDKSVNTENFYRGVFDFIEHNEVEKLIIDLRLNGGGNNYLNKPIIKEIIRSNAINKVGNLYVIIGRRTFSACQNLVNELDNYTNVIFVGEPTAENVNFWGDARPEVLPNSKIPVYLSFAWWQDKPAWENAEWIAPQIPITMSFKEYITNQDPVLQAALTFNAENFIHKPMDYIRSLYDTNQLEKLATEIPKMIQDPKYSFFDFKSELIKSGNQVSNYNPQAAIQIFSFVTHLFPNSIIALKGLGENYIKIGSNKEGKQILEKVIAMDKNGEIAKQAKKLLNNK
ncbi:hypothetical protein [uncultured Tenacibaculum sp.]|uniref:hypothetical protein n=1 Tax=uncultured Tenacibaculum sp. TaxID=174713 RepID=UPI00261A0DFF|nr:hypothetical protein [uncultured Tenacibaculum sp.]